MKRMTVASFLKVGAVVRISINSFVCYFKSRTHVTNKGNAVKMDDVTNDFFSVQFCIFHIFPLDWINDDFHHVVLKCHCTLM